MIITKNLLVEKFNEFNDAYFNNEIDMVTFAFTKTKRRLGCYYPIIHKIEITTFYPNITELDVEKILIHEMCHSWQFCTKHEDTGFRSSHGYWFYYIANRVNIASNYKYNISRLIRLSDETTDGIEYRGIDNIKILVCKKQSDPNTIFVGRVTENAIPKMEKWLGRYYDEIKGYSIEEKDALHFVSYTTSKTRFNYKKMSVSKFHESVGLYIRERNRIKFNDEIHLKKVGV